MDDISEDNLIFKLFESAEHGIREFDYGVEREYKCENPEYNNEQVGCQV
jgi:hypothetical protein